MRKNKRFTASIFVPLLLVGSTHAADLPAGYVPTFGDLSALQAQQMYYELKAKRDEAQAQADKNGRTIGDGGSITSTSIDIASPIPELRGVVGRDLNLFGSFVYSTGSKVDARAGDILPGNYRVSSVGFGKASLIDTKGKTIQLIQQTQGAPVLQQQQQPVTLPGAFPPVNAPVMR
ncbi:type IV pilus biogenesis protein PilP [Pseudomonas siliginis]|uniref:type IV pilus biogenesis protein PilP n=1 Tax=Pseudomonas siliginis TaxID=2842346 RepID=UPI002092256D|nr:type IV pilus biogenesis protein PilP [Pseudomonas siliginis]UST77204.1 type IV pilus biogenesis protein PilP [Pseudomonas siliginis]